MKKCCVPNPAIGIDCSFRVSGLRVCELTRNSRIRNSGTHFMSKKSYLPFQEIYKRLFSQFGPQFWWPGESCFEIIVGAILTQNTNWRNVEKAIVNLRREKLLVPAVLKDISVEDLSRWIKPAGYFNVKAKRLKNFVDFLFREYDGKLQRMKKEAVEKLRRELLSVNGIGPETADSILLYAFDKPIFVVDAYTKRFMARHNWINPDEDYHAVQKKFMRGLAPDVSKFNEYHALIVRLGKEFCKSQPLCEQCPLNDLNYSLESWRRKNGKGAQRTRKRSP